MANYKVVVNRTQEFDDETLFHSDTFLGNEFSDEMYHWKYIKREKVNGKWRYYYNTKGLKNELNDYKNALSSGDELQKVKDLRFRISENKVAFDRHTRARKSGQKGTRTNELAQRDEYLNRELDTAKANYKRAKTFVGKMTDLNKAFRKHNPKIVKKVNKLFGKLKIH